MGSEMCIRDRGVFGMVGTFDSNTSGWTAYRGATLAATSGNLVVSGTGGNYGGSASQGITTVVGKTYTLSFDLVSESGGSNYVAVRDNPDVGGGTTIASVSIAGQSAGTYSVTFTATGTTTYIAIVAQNPAGVTTVDNVSVRLAEEDRSVNGNGLQVFGTVTKNPVATGADLVAYSGFSTSNYLEQPYNSDLNFGTGDFSISMWLNCPSTISNWAVLCQKSGGENYLTMRLHPAATPSLDTELLIKFGNSSWWQTGYEFGGLGWKQLIVTRQNGLSSVYVDGVLQTTNSAQNGDVSHASSLIHRPESGVKTSLFRISATAPSPEQIAKIYEDEKVLFQENAQATLYGSSDAVTALAYDDSTELLHVGTSAGRSDFQGLRRVNNTTNAVGAAISASNGMIVEE